MRYIGKGAFVPVIPARDLSPDETKQHGGVTFLVDTGLYAAPKAQNKPKQAKAPVPAATVED